MRRSGLLLLAVLALGCAHSAQSNGGHAAPRPERLPPQPGDELVRVREAGDIVGRYRDVFGSPGQVTITADAGVLTMKVPPTARFTLSIGDNGTLAVSTFGHAQLFRRGNRTLLNVSGCYWAGLFERTD